MSNEEIVIKDSLTVVDQKTLQSILRKINTATDKKRRFDYDIRLLIYIRGSHSTMITFASTNRGYRVSKMKDYNTYPDYPAIFPLDNGGVLYVSDTLGFYDADMKKVKRINISKIHTDTYYNKVQFVQNGKVGILLTVKEKHYLSKIDLKLMRIISTIEVSYNKIRIGKNYILGTQDSVADILNYDLAKIGYLGGIYNADFLNDDVVIFNVDKHIIYSYEIKTKTYNQLINDTSLNISRLYSRGYFISRDQLFKTNEPSMEPTHLDENEEVVPISDEYVITSHGKLIKLGESGYSKFDDVPIRTYARENTVIIHRENDILLDDGEERREIYRQVDMYESSLLAPHPNDVKRLLDILKTHLPIPTDVDRMILQCI